MAQQNLPIHPSMRHPLTGEPLQALYVDSKGRARYPMMGGAPEGGDGGSGDGGAGGNGGGSGTGSGGNNGGNGGGQQGAGDSGFPANTPVEQMNGEQREAYYKHQSQKWQGRAENSYSLLTKLGVKNDEDAQAIQAKVTKHDELEHELMSDKDKAIADAKKNATAEADAKYQPLLVRAALTTAAASADYLKNSEGNLDEETLEKILEPLDLKKFLTSSGDVDTAKVKTYVEGLAPAKGTGRTHPSGPTVFGLGQQPSPPAAPGAQGKAMAEKRFGTAKS